jgi:rSAM/selenodomain-associated transferase 1
MRNTGSAVVVMARSPLGSRAPKSRLAGILPDESDRRRLYAAFLKDVVSACGSIDGVHLHVAHTVDGGTAGFDAAGVTTDQLLPQRGASLGDRERGVFEDLFGRGFSPVVLVGSDLPTLPATRVEEAVTRLQIDQDRVVLGPSEDGGYYLIGLTRSTSGAVVPDLFSQVRWSTEWTYADTVAAAERCGLAVEALAPWYDIDDATRLERLRKDLATAAGADRAPATRGVLERIGLAGKAGPQS